MKLNNKHVVPLVFAVVCVVGLLVIQWKSRGFGIENGKVVVSKDLKLNDSLHRLTEAEREPAVAQKGKDLRKLPHVKLEPRNLLVLAESIMVKRRMEREILRKQPPFDPFVSSNVIRRIPGAYDPNLCVKFGGKIRTQEEALPQILEYLWQDDKEKLIEAVDALNRFGTSIAETEVIDRLIELYRSTISPKEVDYLFLSQDEGNALELKLAILLTVSSSKDRRKAEILKDAESDVNETVRKVAKRIRIGKPYSPHLPDPADEVP
ncbi:MAG: hypothetical protein WC740_15160 [Verrucomicrobiia bacterium]